MLRGFRGQWKNLGIADSFEMLDISSGSKPADKAIRVISLAPYFSETAVLIQITDKNPGHVIITD